MKISLTASVENNTIKNSSQFTEQSIENKFSFELCTSNISSLELYIYNLTKNK